MSEFMDHDVEDDLDRSTDPSEPTLVSREARGYNKRVIYGAGAVAAAALIGFSFLGGSRDGRRAQLPAVADAGELVGDPPYAYAARPPGRRVDSVTAAPVPPPSSAVIGGADGQPYSAVGRGAQAPADSVAAGGQNDNPVAAPGTQSSVDPRIAAWRAVRDASPTSGWGGETGRSFAAVPAFDPTESALQGSGSTATPLPGEPFPGGEAVGSPREQGGRPAEPTYSMPALTRIDAALVSAVVSEVPGDVVAQVTRDVMDARGEHVAIPAGSRLVGRQADQVGVGQRRIVVSWTLLQLPDRTLVSLPGLGAADEQGEAGVPGRVNTHVSGAFGRALLLSAISAGFQISQPQPASSTTPSAGSVAATAVGQQLAALSAELLRRDVSAHPTIRVPAGSYVAVLVSSELAVPARNWSRMSPGASQTFGHAPRR